jgi:arylsulfatase A-like enzyme
VDANSAIVFVADRLNTGCMGPYGNTWIDTPQFNRLASQSILFEYPYVDSPDLTLTYRSYWSGSHAMAGAIETRSSPLLRRLGEAQVQSVLLTDDGRVANHALAGEFDQRIALSPLPAEEAAEDIGETQIAQLFAAATDWLERATPPFLLWVHARAMEGPWDAPLSYRRQFAEEDDPLPPDFSEPPCRRLPAGFDPDELLGVLHAYAGQVALLDACLGVFLDALDKIALGQTALADQAALVFVSPRGFPVGEHGRIGACDDALYGELLHTPWMIRLPHRRGAAARSHALIQPPDLCATLLDWCVADPADPSMWGLSTLPAVESQRIALRDRACAVGLGQRAIRTPAWFLREDLPAGRRELFAKPDDRWEANEVSDRCRDVTLQLVEALNQFQRAAELGRALELPPLAEGLLEGIA